VPLGGRPELVAARPAGAWATAGGLLPSVEIADRTLPDTSLGLLVAEAAKGRDSFLA